MKNSFLALTLLLGLGCGGGNEQEAQQQAQALADQLGASLTMAAEQAAEQAQQQAGQAAQAAQAAQPAGGSNFGTVELTSGFMPDPHVVTGTSGGSIDASTWDASCNGNVSQQPDHLFTTQSNFSTLRIIAHAQGDTTLVVQKPDGTYVCNDDAEDLNPIVEGAFGPGTYKIWVGSYEPGANLAYRLGFTELSSVTAAQVGGGS
ncbi:MAG: hypothetical protein KF901_21190 [Myxococcales bacterium]|nr:hypothetical protein [Myxococcales bacterium]